MQKKILTIIFSFLFAMGIKAQKMEQNKIEFPKSFILAKQEFLKSQVFIAPKIFIEQGIEINTNPGTIKEKQKIKLLAGGFNTNDINQIYYEIYANKQSRSEESAHIVVAEFNSIALLDKNMRVVDEAGLYYPSYFTTGKYLIIIGCKDRTLLENISNFYVKNVGATYYYPKH